jgi:hypothetical protein
VAAAAAPAAPATPRTRRRHAPHHEQGRTARTDVATRFALVQSRQNKQTSVMYAKTHEILIFEAKNDRNVRSGREYESAPTQRNGGARQQTRPRRAGTRARVHTRTHTHARHHFHLPTPTRTVHSKSMHANDATRITALCVLRANHSAADSPPRLRRRRRTATGGEQRVVGGGNAYTQTPHRCHKRDDA